MQKCGSALWLFGYGSLIWRPDFEYEERRAAWVQGWRRRFWQASPDHRGTPAFPGRVVTLAPESGALCHGAAYRLRAAAAEKVLARLDERESGGYQKRPVRLCFADGVSVMGITYIAGAENPNYAGPAALAEIAAVARRARGKSGANREYVFALAAALRALPAHCPHTFALEKMLKQH